jgi:hypothetical protein
MRRLRSLEYEGEPVRDANPEERRDRDPERFEDEER